MKSFAPWIKLIELQSLQSGAGRRKTQRSQRKKRRHNCHCDTADIFFRIFVPIITVTIVIGVRTINYNPILQPNLNATQVALP